ncbi:hypothetical protein D3C81_1830200 [compost metagenome]
MGAVLCGHLPVDPALGHIGHLSGRNTILLHLLGKGIQHGHHRRPRNGIHQLRCILMDMRLDNITLGQINIQQGYIPQCVQLLHTQRIDNIAAVLGEHRVIAQIVGILRIR